MALDRTVIAGAPATTRADAKTVLGEITSVIPPGPRLSVVDGVLTYADQYPEREGQMLFHRNGSDLFVTMYVVVAIDSELMWKKVENWGVVIDPRTGLEKDPSLNFYSTLAY